MAGNSNSGRRKNGIKTGPVPPTKPREIVTGVPRHVSSRVRPIVPSDKNAHQLLEEHLTNVGPVTAGVIRAAIDEYNTGVAALGDSDASLAKYSPALVAHTRVTLIQMKETLEILSKAVGAMQVRTNALLNSLDSMSEQG